MLETNAKRPKLVSPFGDESPSLPVLPHELILEILLRVPVRSLLRFRCVCKSWKTLISDPQFAKDHLRASTADPNMTHQRIVSSVLGNHFKIASFSVQSLFQNPSTPTEGRCFRMRRRNQILGSCNGLLCMFDVYKRCVRLWNPSTRLKSKRLSTGASSGAEITYHGFGYDHLNDKYKLLVVVEDIGPTVTKICTFGANSWTVLQNFPCQPTGWRGKFVGGTLNWIAKRGVSDDQWVIVSLDLGTETYGEVLLPDGDGHKIGNPVLDVLQNCLCVCFFDSNNAHWVVWLMKEYGVQKSWTKLMTIPHVVEVEDIMTDLVMIPEDQRGICKWYHSLDPLCISENGVVLVRTKFSKLVLYNPNDGRLDYRRIRQTLGLGYLYIYHQSLVSPRR